MTTGRDQAYIPGTIQQVPDGIVQLVRTALNGDAYDPRDPEADQLADLIESMTETESAYLSEHIPPAIAKADPLEFGDFRPVTVDEITGIIRP
ncbi:MAG: hypothetical protein ACE5FV_08975 [Woeseia sp.]